MRKSGTVVRWEEARGVGVIRGSDTPTDVIFRGRDFEGTPAQGLAVEYDEVVLGGRSVHATAIRVADAAMAAASPEGRRASARRPADASRRPDRQRRRGATPVVIGIVAWFGALVAATVAGRLAVPVLLALPLYNLFVFFLYWHNRHARSRGATHIPEDALHVLAALGGWPGAWLAQRLLRYQPATAWFHRAFWIAVGVNVAWLAGWLLLGGA